MISDLKNFSESDIRTYLTVLTGIAKTDGLHKKEVAFINVQSELADIEPSSIWDTETDIGDLKSLPKQLKKITLRDAITLSYIDGFYSERERAKVGGLVEQLGLTNEESNQIEDWLRDYWEVIQRGERLFD